MPMFDGLFKMPVGAETDIMDHDFDGLLDLLVDILENESPSVRPQDSQQKPGAVFTMNPDIENVLYFGDIHPSKKNVGNFLEAIAPYFHQLQQGCLGIVLAGDFTHPAEDDLTDMEPSFLLLRHVLIPLKILFPRQIVLLRGDHETVGSPYGEDFGKGTDFLPDWTLEGGLQELIGSGLIWAMGPNKPEFSDSGSKFSGIYCNAPTAERLSLGGKEFGRDSFLGSWHVFDRIEAKDGYQYLIFQGSEKRPNARWVRIDHDRDRVRFILEEEDQDFLCSLAVNQSRAYGRFIERMGGRKDLEKLQYKVYDQLPLIVTGVNFAGVHGSPVEKLSPHDDSPIIAPLERKELIELSQPDFRRDHLQAFRRLIFGRPIEGDSFSFTPRIVEKFLSELGNDSKDLFLMAHTRPDHFLEGYRRIYPTRGPELLLNQDVYTLFGPGWDHLVVDSQSKRCSHLLIENRRPDTAAGETIRDLYSLQCFPDDNQDYA